MSSSIHKILDIGRDLMDPLQECGQDFFREAELPGKFKLGIFLNSWDTLLRTGIGSMWKFVRDDKVCGLLGAILSYDMNDGDTIAAETFWYVLREERKGLGGIRLFEAFDDWATQVGAKRIMAAHIMGLHDDKMREFYTRRGYTAREMNYVKELEDMLAKR